MLCRVGPHEYSRADLDLRRKYVAYMYPQSATQELGALSQLITGALSLVVLEELGEPITEAQLDAEIERIFKGSQDAGGLNALMRMAGGRDTPAFRRVIILPDFANSRYHFQVFPTREDLQRPMRERAQKALDSIRTKSPPDLYQAAVDLSCEYQRLGFSAQRGFFKLEDHEEAHAPAASWAVQLEDEVLSALKEGEVHPQVLDLHNALYILRWVCWSDQSKKERIVERLVFNKVDAQDYFWQRAATVPVCLSDNDLKEKLYREVDWAKRLNWQ